MSRIPAQYVCVLGEDCSDCQRQAQLLQRCNVSILRFADLQECMQTLSACPCALLVVSLDQDPEGRLQLLRWSRQACPMTTRIALVGRGNVPLTVSAMKAGVHECVETPLKDGWWRSAIQAALSKRNDMHPHGNETLTETEKFVWSQVVVGKTSKEIAAALHRSLRTIEVHRTHIMRKLGVSSTVDLVRRGLMTGLPDSVKQPEPDAHGNCEVSDKPGT